MKKLTQLFENSYESVAIKWHSPVRLAENWEEYSKINQTDIFFYKIIAKRGEKYKLIYIGMSEKQSIHQRLYNKDHRLKQQIMKENNNGWVLYSCLGELKKTKDENDSYEWSKNNVPLIEKMLIITHSDFPSLTNKIGINWFSCNAWIKIKNTGFLKDEMYKIITYGLCSTES